MSLLHDVTFMAHFAQCKVSAKQQVNSLIDAIYAKVLLDLELWLNKHESNDSVHSLALNEPTSEQMQSSTDLFTLHVPQSSNYHQTDSITAQSSSFSVKSQIFGDDNEIEVVDSRELRHDSNEFDCFNHVSALTHDHEGNGLMIRDRETIFNAHQYHCQSLDKSHSIDANCQLNPTKHPPALNSIGHSITDPLNVQFEPQLNDHSINSSSSAQESTLIPSTSTEQTLPNTEIQQQVHIKHNQFDDEEECVDDEIEVKKEDVGRVQLIEDDQEVEVESPRPKKKPRMDTTQIKNVQPKARRHSQKKPTDEAQTCQVIHQDKQFITVHLQCPELECSDKFAEIELNDHLMEKHLIGLNRCLVKDCAQSFGNTNDLGEHIKQVHQGTIKCDKLFTKYLQLSVHNNRYHQLGLFQCSFPSCTFTGEYRKKVYIHYEYVHKEKPELMCQQFGCSYRTNRSIRLKEHERAHLGIKPYRCKWTNCDYSSASQNNAISHIKAHFKSSKTNSSPDLTHLGKPKDYLEVVF